MNLDNFTEFLDELTEEQMAVNVGMANRWWAKIPTDMPVGSLKMSGRRETKSEIYCNYLHRTPLHSGSLAETWWRLLSDRNKVRVYFDEEELEEDD